MKAGKQAKKESMVLREVSTGTEKIMILVLTILALIFIMPIAVVVMNSFKGKLYISSAPFELPTAETFAGLENYMNGIAKTGLPSAFGYSVLLRYVSCIVIVIFTSMTAWYITRVKTWCYKDALFYVRICDDRSVSDGYVPNVENCQYAGIG